jgi:hypothetical protein
VRQSQKPKAKKIVYFHRKVKTTGFQPVSFSATIGRAGATRQ